MNQQTPRNDDRRLKSLNGGPKEDFSLSLMWHCRDDMDSGSRSCIDWWRWRPDCMTYSICSVACVDSVAPISTREIFRISLSRNPLACGTQS